MVPPFVSECVSRNSEPVSLMSSDLGTMIVRQSEVCCRRGALCPHASSPIAHPFICSPLFRVYLRVATLRSSAAEIVSGCLRCEEPDQTTAYTETDVAAYNEHSKASHRCRHFVIGVKCQAHKITISGFFVVLTVLRWHASLDRQGYWPVIPAAGGCCSTFDKYAGYAVCYPFRNH